MAAGLIISEALRSDARCSFGFVVVHMMMQMIHWLICCGIACSTQVDSSVYASHNNNFVQQLSDTMSSRKIIATGLTFPYMLLVHMIGGLSEAAVALLPYSSSDAYVIAAVLWTLSSVRYRFCVVSITIVLFLRLPAPHGYDLLRGCCFILSFICRHIQKQNLTFHTLILYVVVLMYANPSCSDVWSVLSPVTLLSYAICAQLNPVVMLTVVLLACLV